MRKIERLRHRRWSPDSLVLSLVLLIFCLTQSHTVSSCACHVGCVPTSETLTNHTQEILSKDAASRTVSPPARALFSTAEEVDQVGASSENKVLCVLLVQLPIGLWLMLPLQSVFLCSHVSRFTDVGALSLRLSHGSKFIACGRMYCALEPCVPSSTKGDNGTHFSTFFHPSRRTAFSQHRLAIKWRACSAPWTDRGESSPSISKSTTFAHMSLRSVPELVQVVLQVIDRTPGKPIQRVLRHILVFLVSVLPRLVDEALLWRCALVRSFGLDASSRP